MSLFDALQDQARERPGHPAIEDGDRIVSFGDLPKLIEASAWRLHKEGFRPGDFVGVMARDCAEQVIVILALGRIGAVVVSINGNQPIVERQRAVSKLTLQAVLTSWPESEPMHERMIPLASVCTIESQDCPRFEEPPPGPDEPFVCRQSSGTTGVPKSILWSSAELLRLRDRLQARLGWVPSDRYYQLVRLCFTFSRDQVIQVLTLGITVVINDARTTKEQVRNIRERGITFVFATNAHLRAFLAAPCDEPPLFPDLRVLVSTSGAITSEERQAATARLSPNFYDGYGTNEVGGLVFAGPEDIAAAPASLGRVLADIEAVIIGPDGAEVAAGEIGLAAFRCDGFPVRYHEDPEATASHFQGGWYLPGDLMAIERDGRVTFKGRADNVINNQGAKFYPLEVEQVLTRHPDIDEAVVFGWRSSKAGQVAVACLVGRRVVEMEEILAFCRVHLAAHKVPALVTYARSLPKTSSGKVRLQDVKEMMRPMLEKSLS